MIQETPVPDFFFNRIEHVRRDVDCPPGSLHLTEANVRNLAADIFEGFDAGRVIWPRDLTIEWIVAAIRRYAK